MNKGLRHGGIAFLRGEGHVGIIDLMNKGLRHSCCLCVNNDFSLFVGIIDLMNKGLRL